MSISQDGVRPPLKGDDPYRELFERSSDAILIIEGDTFVDCNDAAVKMLGYANKAEVLRTHPSQLSPPTQPDGRSSYEKANEMMATAFERGSHRFEWDHVRANGEVFPVEVLLTAIQEPDRQVLHVVWRDVSNRKELENRLRHSQKMEAIGTLAGGIAHDFNNMLVVIRGHADMLGELLDGDAEGEEHVKQIAGAADRASNLVKQLLTFGRKQQIKPTVLDLNEVIRQTVGLLRPLAGDDVEIAVDLCSTPAHVKADIGQIEQVLMNVTSNARDAMPSGGKLCFKTEVLELRGAEAGQLRTLTPGRYACLSIEDNGVGMVARTLNQAFDPFFTTKGVGQGTGLGLATVYGVARQNGGDVEIHSSPGAGTTVTVYLPTTDQELDRDPKQSEATGSPGGGDETILVVEDEPGVAALVVRALQSRGYRVLSASNGREASAVFLQNPSSIDLIVSDVIMPLMGGPQLILELANKGFNPRVLFMSGYTNDALRYLEPIGKDVDFIQKPFQSVDLARRVREALDL